MQEVREKGVLPAEDAILVLVHKLANLSSAQLRALGAVCSGIGALRDRTRASALCQTQEYWRFSEAVWRVLAEAADPELTLLQTRRALEAALEPKHEEAI